MVCSDNSVSSFRDVFGNMSVKSISGQVYLYIKRFVRCGFSQVTQASLVDSTVMKVSSSSVRGIISQVSNDSFVSFSKVCSHSYVRGSFSQISGNSSVRRSITQVRNDSNGDVRGSFNQV